MKARLNWIDWAKAFAITFVVFGHIPEEKSSFFLNYVTTFHMPLFFFISGLLTKKENPSKDTFKKYWQTLVVPYLLYNIIFYPFWMVRYLIEIQQIEPYDFLKPIFGTLILQISTAYTDTLNGVTWFVAALLIMKIILAVCNKLKHGRLLIAAIISVCILLYMPNEQYKYETNLLPVGFLKCFPFFCLGYAIKKRLPSLMETNGYNWLWATAGITVSCVLFYHNILQENVLLKTLRFWAICLFAIAGWLNLCKVLDKIHWNAITNISTGTIVIMGLHWALMGTTNYALERVLHLSEGILYPWYIAIALAIIFDAIIYPFIIIAKKKYPIWLGKRK